MRKVYLIFIFAPLFFFVKDSSASDTTKVLFLGNSYTYANNLPDLFGNLAKSAGKNILTGISAPGGYMLENHKTDETSLSLIRQGGWDFVILQEQSQAPTIEHYRYNSMFPSARFLDSLIKLNNLHTCFFMTWGRQNGGQQCIDSFCSPVFTNFFHMQDSLKSAYSEISSMLNAILCPVGEAWRKARLLQPGIDLWESDESHPTIKGSYLAACVFYAKIFNLSPVGLSYIGTLSQADALFLQNCAYQTVISVGNEALTLAGFELFQNFPNPFNGRTRINFSLNITSYPKIIVSDVTGRIVSCEIIGYRDPGNYNLVLDMNGFPSGVYFYTLIAGNERITRKMLMVK